MKAAIICFFITAALAGRSQGFIDYEAVKREYPKQCGFQQAFDERLQQLEDSCGMAAGKIQKTLESIIPLHRALSKAEETAFNDSLKAMALAIDRLRLFAQDQLMRMQRSMERQVKAGLSEELQQFCESEGLHFLSEEKAILYNPGVNDYTQAFISYLSAKK